MKHNSFNQAIDCFGGAMTAAWSSHPTSQLANDVRQHVRGSFHLSRLPFSDLINNQTTTSTLPPTNKRNCQLASPAMLGGAASIYYYLNYVLYEA